MTNRIHLFARALAGLALIIPLRALEPWEYAVDVRVEAQASPPAIHFSWPSDDMALEYTISRKLPHEQHWSPLAQLPGESTGYTDSLLSAGAAFEYEIQKATRFFPYPEGNPDDWISAYSYVFAGVQAPLKDDRGKVILIVDSAVAGAISSELALFIQDLAGAGWQPIRRDAPRTSSVMEIKDIIRSEYSADPARVRSVILIGHVPVPYSGNISPDMHEGHRGAWPADAYYGDMDGQWTDHAVNTTSGWYPENHNVPGDGKFDQSQLPSDVELAVGRIDFYEMPSFASSEAELLRNYLRKNHAFRHRAFTLPRRGLVRDNFGDVSGDAPAVDAWRHYSVFFGPGNVREIGRNEFFSTLDSEGFLWSYAGGGGDYQFIDAVGGTADFARHNPRSVFMMLHGSYFGDWDNPDNILRAAIASGDYALASIWTGLPHWFMHHMALGETLGYSTRVSQNNLNLYKTHRNFSAREVHVSLIGDPTLEMFPVIPPSNLRAQSGSSVQLDWNPSSGQNIAGYHVYHSQSSLGPFQRLTSTPVPGTSFSHAPSGGTHHYMVRAVKLEETGSGTFYNASQGIFAEVDLNGTVQFPVINLAAEDGDASEQDGNPGSFRVTRSIVTGEPFRIYLDISGSAQNGTDYASIPDFADIPAGAASASIAVAPVADGSPEGDETVTVALRPHWTYVSGTPGSGSLVIKDFVASNERPSISEIADQTLSKNGPGIEVSFSVNDEESPAEALTLRAASSNKSLVPDENLALGGSGSERTLRITPAPGQSGTAKITIVVSDGELEGTRAFFVRVIDENSAPAAHPQSVNVLAGGSVSITLTGSDPDGDPLQFILLAQPEKGGLGGTPPSLTYTANAGQSGTDTFTFQVSDGELSSSSALITIHIGEVNQPPAAEPQALETSEDTALEILLEGADPDGNAIEFALLSDPVHGQLTGTPPNLTYTPDINWHGTDSFRFQVSDGAAESEPAEVMLDILPVDDPPAGISQSVVVPEEESRQILLAGTDPEGAELSFTIVTEPSNGRLSGAPPNMDYTPDPDFAGSDFFSFTADDGELQSAPAQVFITVTPKNDPPVIAPVAGLTIRKNSGSGPIPILISDPDTPENLLALVVGSGNAALVATTNIFLSGTGSNRVLTITSRPGAVGSTTISLEVIDGLLRTRTAFELTVTNSPPRAQGEVVSHSGGTLALEPADLLANDSDPDGDPLAIKSVDAASALGGTVLFSGSGIAYLPPPGWNTADHFEYVIEDDTGGRATARVTILPESKPRLSAIALEISGNVRLSFSGPPGAEFRVLASGDLRVWNEIGRAAAREDGSGEFLDESAPGEARRFYRLEQQ